MKTIDIVVPCYNEQEVIAAYYEETSKHVAAINNYSFRYIFVNDGSRDNTLLLLKGLAADHDDVRYVSFSRNFGKEAAMFAGLKNTTADYVIVMDADLQHPPALFPKLIEGIEEGYDCCAAYRTTRTGEKKIRSFFSQSFYKLNNKLTNTKMPYGAVDYRIMSRQMVNSLVELPEKERFSKGLFCWVGFDTKWIPYENVERTLGTTKWKFSGLVKYAMDAIISFSVAPLRMLSVIGATIRSLALLYGFYLLIKTLVFGKDLPGYASTIIILLFLGGIIELSIGIIGEYLARIFTEVKQRPIYIEKESNINKDKEKDISNEKSDK